MYWFQWFKKFGWSTSQQKRCWPDYSVDVHYYMDILWKNARKEIVLASHLPAQAAYDPWEFPFKAIYSLLGSSGWWYGWSWKVGWLWLHVKETEQREGKEGATRKHHQHEAEGSGPPSYVQIKSLWFSQLSLFPPDLHLFLIFSFLKWNPSVLLVKLLSSSREEVL